MFGVPGTLGAKIPDLGLGGWGAHLCYSLPSPGRRCGRLWPRFYPRFGFVSVHVGLGGPRGPKGPKKRDLIFLRPPLASPNRIS